MEIYTPRGKILYYFAYHLVNGNPFPLMWVEDDGLVVGGIPDVVPDTKVEISQEEFEKGDLAKLSREWPFRGLPPEYP